MKEVVETINPLKYFDLSHRNSNGYDSVNMLQCVLLAFGYVSLRKLASLCRYDIRFQFIMDGQTPSHMAFHRFIHDDLKMPIEEIFYDLNRYFEKNDTIDRTEQFFIDRSGCHLYAYEIRLL
ncbi:transposase [Absicoccus porci]|uniref:Transposase n=1 Tax=Absicoccus porci TaxID=2486576 RepID=A0A3N0I3H6_9FIRM|nr:transposase [Absicoccus porci]